VVNPALVDRSASVEAPVLVARLSLVVPQILEASQEQADWLVLVETQSFQALVDKLVPVATQASVEQLPVRLPNLRLVPEFHTGSKH
jgi:hypothetical protein